VNGFEIRPDAGGCGCGGCGGEKKAAPVHPLLGRSLEGFEIFSALEVVYRPLSELLEDTLGGVTYGLGPSQGPASNACAQISAQIEAMNARIEGMWRMMRAALGAENADRLRGTWRAARAACAAVTTSDPCQALWDSWQASPVEGPGVAMRNAIWHVWNQCTINRVQFAAASGPNGFLCYLLRENARRIERDLSTRRGVTPPYNYERDIEPLERELDALGVLLVECISRAQGTGMGPSVTCRLIGSSGCRNGVGTCSYGGDCGTRCSRQASCPQGEHSPRCPEYANCP